MQRKIRLMIGILIMTGLIAGCWKVSKNLQKELKEEMEKHVRCFNMEGLTTKIMNAED